MYLLRYIVSENAVDNYRKQDKGSFVMISAGVNSMNEACDCFSEDFTRLIKRIRD